MIHSAITCLIFAICVVALLQPSARRLLASAIFASATVLHEVLLSHKTGLIYYGSAALLDLATMILLSAISRPTKTMIRLQCVCIASIAANFFGFCAWVVYMSPTAYNSAFVGIYLWALLILIHRGTPDDVGCHTFSSRAARLFCYFNPRSNNLCNNF